jgi:formate hydrogenlyase transcriptional activator
MSLTTDEKNWLRGLLPLIDFMRCLSKDEVDLLVNNTTKAAYKINTVILNQSRVSDSFCIVGQGSVSIWKNTDKDKIFIARLDAGKCFGEFGIINNEPASADVIASGDVVVYKIEKREFVHLLDKNPKFKSFIQSLAEKRKEENKRHGF